MVHYTITPFAAYTITHILVYYHIITVTTTRTLTRYQVSPQSGVGDLLEAYQLQLLISVSTTSL